MLSLLLYIKETEDRLEDIHFLKEHLLFESELHQLQTLALLFTRGRVSGSPGWPVAIQLKMALIPDPPASVSWLLICRHVPPCSVTESEISIYHSVLFLDWKVFFSDLQTFTLTDRAKAALPASSVLSTLRVSAHPRLTSGPWETFTVGR